MIKSVSIVRRVAREEDFRAVAGFLGAIGFERFSENGNEKSASFVAPVGKLWIDYLDNQRSPEFIELMKHYHDGVILLEVNDPETVWLIAHKRGYEMPWDSVSKRTGRHTFAVKLPGEILVWVVPASEQASAIEGDFKGTGKSFAAVISRFNSFITERLLQGALDGLTRSGVSKRDIQIVRVPGAFEIPMAARTVAQTKKYDAIICIGCLLRGDTAHYDVIVNEVTRGIGQSAQETGVPHAFGVLTCDTLEQAIDRAGLKMGNKGFEAALAAVEMANLKKAVVRRSSLAVRKNKTKTNTNKTRR